MTSALFGRSATGLGSTGGFKHLVEVKAGKMNLKGKMVLPDKRKGLLFLYRSDDSLIHFCWQDRTSGVVEDDLIIFPDDCEFVKVTKCPESARVYSLKFKSSRRLFFWIQEPNDKKDEETCKKINQCISNPSSVVASNNAASSILANSSQETDLQSLLNSMSHSQLMQLFSGQVSGLSTLVNSMNSSSSSTPVATSAAPEHSGGSSGPTTPSVTPASVQSSGKSTPKTSISASTTDDKSSSKSGQSKIRLADLQNFLQNIQTDSQETKDLKVDLVSSFHLDVLKEFLSKKDVKERLKNFLPSVDNETPSDAQFNSTITSPQFKQALSQFSHALQSGQLAPVISKMNLSAECVKAANRGNLLEFVQALEASASASPESTESSESKEKDNEHQSD